MSKNVVLISIAYLIFVAVFIICLFTSCTVNVSATTTDRGTSELDETQENDPTISPTLTIPLL